MKNLFRIGKVAMLLISAFLIGSLAASFIAAPLATSFPDAVPFVAVAIIGYTMYKCTFAKPVFYNKNHWVTRNDFTQGLCEKIQTSLIATLGAKSPSLMRTPTGYMDAIQSPQNTAGVTKIPIPTDGKKRQVRLKYIQRGTSDDILDTPPEDCSGEIEREPFEETVDVTRYIRTKRQTFTQDQLRFLCEADNDYIAAQVRALVDPASVELNKKLIALQATNFGKFNNADDYIAGSPEYKEVELLKSDDAPNYIGEKRMMDSFYDLNFMGQPLIIGDGILSDYTEQAKIGCCNADGINVGSAAKFSYYRDRFAGGILGNRDKFIGLVPGYVQLLTWNKYVTSAYMRDTPIDKASTFTDPTTGITWDQKWIWDVCTEKWTVYFFLNYDMFFLPLNAFATTDELHGANMTLQFKGKKAA